VTQEERRRVVERAAEAVVAYRQRDTPVQVAYRGTSAEDVLDDALGPAQGFAGLRWWAWHARRAYRRAAVLEGVPSADLPQVPPKPQEPRRATNGSGRGEGHSEIVYGRTRSSEADEPGREGPVILAGRIVNPDGLPVGT